MAYKVAVVGATGNVGREMLRVLVERQFPFSEVVALASTRSVATPVQDASPASDRSAKPSNSRSATDAGAAKPAAKPRAVPEAIPQRNLLGEIDPSRDPFVRQVIETFGATVVKVTVAPSVQIADTEAAS